MFLIIIINNINHLCIIILILQVLLFQYNKKEYLPTKNKKIYSITMYQQTGIFPIIINKYESRKELKLKNWRKWFNFTWYLVLFNNFM